MGGGETHSVDVMVFTQLIKGHVHGVQYTHHLHGPQPRAHGSEADNVAEQDGNGGKLPASVERGFPLAELVSDWLGQHLVEEFVGALDAVLQLGTADLLLRGWGEMHGL